MREPGKIQIIPILIISAIILLFGVLTIYFFSPFQKRYDYSGWKTYANEKLDYLVKYPGDCEVRGEDLDQAVELVGPGIEFKGIKERWPRIFIRHYDSSFFQPAEGTDVKKLFHNFPGYDEKTRIRIGGRPAAHLRQKATPQSFSGDSYFFIKGGQLYQILILHAAGKSDPELYDKFLKGFRFTR